MGHRRHHGSDCVCRKPGATFLTSGTTTDLDKSHRIAVEDLEIGHLLYRLPPGMRMVETPAASGGAANLQTAGQRGLVAQNPHCFILLKPPCIFSLDQKSIVQGVAIKVEPYDTDMREKNRARQLQAAIPDEH